MANTTAKLKKNRPRNANKMEENALFVLKSKRGDKNNYKNKSQPETYCYRLAIKFI